jgi:serine phosphatase RsbU (regulator of sigma subunit)
MNTEKQMDIFIVDDNKVFSLALKGAIENAFENKIIKIYTFETGEKCMNAFDMTVPELVILDFNLNSLLSCADDGLKVLDKIKFRSPNTDVIMLTSNDHIDIALRSFQNGVSDYIIKTEDQFKKINESLYKIFADKDLSLKNSENEKRAFELIISEREAEFHKEQKEKSDINLALFSKELELQNEKIEKKSSELLIAKIELGFQKEEKEKNALDLITANKLLAFQKKVKKKLKEELLTINVQKAEVERSKFIIEEKNKDITASIKYAQRIQEAKLPREEEIYSAFSNSFVLFKPKDIVSGDFYSFHKNHQSLFISAADCTGHGVPGAFMSMIGSAKLDEAIANSSDTSEILKYLNKGIKSALQQSESNESTRDGMDIAICSVDTKKFIVKYSGANRPLWIIRKGASEVEEIKGTKKAIGGLTEDDQHFESHTIKLRSGDTFYITTDGYSDQFGGPFGKKMMTKKFKQILLDIQDKPMTEQKKYLDDFVETWRAEKEQLDDILVIGVRF